VPCANFPWGIGLFPAVCRRRRGRAPLEQPVEDHLLAKNQLNFIGVKEKR
jgi:hypothetical protein